MKRITLVLGLLLCGCQNKAHYEQGNDFVIVQWSKTFSNVCCTAECGGKWVMIPGPATLPPPYPLERK